MFTQLVYLNPNNFCTQDGILSTVLHEAIHGYINYHHQLALHERLGYTFDDLYRDFPFLDREDPAGNDSQHDEMINNYVNVIADALRANNSELSQEHANALARGGLAHSDYFSELIGDSVDELFIRRVTDAATCNLHDGDDTAYNFVDC